MHHQQIRIFYKKVLRAVTLSGLFSFLYVPVLMANYAIDNARLENVDTSKWRCKFCPEEEGLSGNVVGFFGYSDEDIAQRFKNTEAEGEQGQISVSADILHKESNDQAAYILDGVGDDNVRAAIAYQNYEDLRAGLAYSRSNHYFGEEALSLYSNEGNNDLRLPPAWQSQTTTGSMDFSNLHKVQNFQQRETLEAEAQNVFGDNRLAMSVHYRQQIRSGTGWTSGSILNDVTALPEQRNDRLRELTVNAAIPFSYLNGAGRVGLELFNSVFDNDHQSLSWDNPFTPAIAGADRGRLALAPDNQYQSWRFFSQYSLDKHRFDLSFRQGRGTQDEDFLAYTSNTLLLTQALPGNDYDGEVETRNARLLWQYRINPQWQLKTRYRFDERDNVSDILEYAPVLTDSLVQGTIKNLRYSHKKSNLELDLDWRWRPRTHFGYLYEYQRFSRQKESSGDYAAHLVAFYWKERWRADIQTRAKIEAQERNQKQQGSANSPGDNLLFRDFTVADRLRNAAEFNLDWQYSSKIQLSANAVYRQDDFENTLIGVKESEDQSLGLNLSWQFNRDLSSSASFQRSWLSWKMAGSAQQSVATWHSTQDDQYDVFTLGVRRSGFINDTLSVGLNYTYVASEGETELGANTDYAQLRSHGHTLQSYLSYQWQPEWQLRVEALYERYQSDNPALIAVNSLSGVIGNNIQDENYSNWLLGLRLQYRIPE